MKLTESLHEVYEPEWYGRDDVKIVGEKCDVLWEDFHQKLVDGALLTLDTYLGQFPDIKTRIAKRSRKLVDYDSARHHLEALQNAKRRDEGRISKAEEEFQKAQKVFEDFNVDLQEELPSLWSRRIGFYVNTFQNITSIEAKFHKEITGLCHKLYEVMTKLGDQHADKAFTIQGAPSDSGPLRIAKTPSPPEESSPLPSPVASPNHTLAPASPAPARPKSPSQLRKGPPVPPLPKLTPSKELQQENIISFFEDNFVPEINVTTPSQNDVVEAATEETLLDLDFDPFKPEGASPGIAQTHSPISQTLPWDLWTTSNELVQPASSSAFNGFSQPEASTSLFTTETEQPVVQNLIDEETPQLEAPQLEAQTDESEPLHPSLEVETSTAVPTEVTEEVVETNEAEGGETPVRAEAESQEKADDHKEESNRHDEQLPTEVRELEAEPLPEEVQEEKLETEPVRRPEEVLEQEPEPEQEPVQKAEHETESNLGEHPEPNVPQEKIIIPSVVIEPASNNEDEEDFVDGIAHDHSVSAAGETVSGYDASQSESSKDVHHASSVPSEDHTSSHDMPPNLLYKVEALHDFEAANADELNLKRGDIVLVIPSEAEADQEAGWLTGIKESDWLQFKKIPTYKGLFPENFTSRLK